VDGEPLEIALQDPAKEFAELYRFARFLDKQPIRVSIPVAPGFRKAVVVASALQFAVRLIAVQPDASVIKELDDTLEFYLHDRSVRQPIEFFHTFLYALYHDAKITLWDIDGKARPSTALPSDCLACPYADHCAGFFKSPRANYACDGVKEILGKLSSAAAQLHRMTHAPHPTESMP
jgi:hypothetical protein